MYNKRPKYDMMPPELRLVSAASSYPHRHQLPINLLLLIISHLDDIATLANVTRTSRLLYYLTIPRLYEKVTLRAYSSIRYIDDRPEGFGGGSPFAMGLDGLISSPNNVAQYVKALRLCGDWKETDAGDFERGRVPDNTMILNVAIKAAITRADTLERFSWELNTKPMKTIYQGLATRTHLTHLKIVFPSCRIPRPSVLIPSLPRLKSLHIANMDPLCYNDDFSLLLAEAKGLKTLKLDWSPRMRQNKEPSVHLGHHFGRLANAKHKIRLKHIVMANMFAKHDETMGMAFDMDSLESMTFMNCMDYASPGTVFLDTTWSPKTQEIPFKKSLRSLRADRVDPAMCQIMATLENLQELYLVNNRNWPQEIEKKRQRDTLSESPGINGASTTRSASEAIPPVTIEQLPNGHSYNHNHNHTSTQDTPNNNNKTPRSSETSAANSPSLTIPPALSKRHISLASDYIATITAHQGPNMRNLLLLDTWTLGKDVIQHILTACPNLEQLALSLEDISMEYVRHILRSLPKLFALRLLFTPDTEFWRGISLEPGLHEFMMSMELWRDEYKNLKWFGTAGQIVKICGRKPSNNPKRPPYEALIKSVSWEEVQHVEIFGMDNTDI